MSKMGAGPEGLQFPAWTALTESEEDIQRIKLAPSWLGQGTEEGQVGVGRKSYRSREQEECPNWTCELAAPAAPGSSQTEVREFPS